MDDISAKDRIAVHRSVQISRQIFIRTLYNVRVNGNDVYYVMRNGKAGRREELHDSLRNRARGLRQRDGAAKC